MPNRCFSASMVFSIAGKRVKISAGREQCRSLAGQFPFSAILRDVGKNLGMEALDTSSWLCHHLDPEMLPLGTAGDSREV